MCLSLRALGLLSLRRPSKFAFVLCIGPTEINFRQEKQEISDFLSD